MAGKTPGYDVLVIGAGGAGLRAALAAKEEDPNVSVLLVTKGRLGKSGVTAAACSDRMAFQVSFPWTPPGGEDSWKRHADDIYRIGGYVSDGDLALILARNSRQAYDYLDKLSVPFVKRKGRPVQFLTDGSRFPRACFTGPYTAVHISRALCNRLRETDVEVLENHSVVRLLTDSKGKRVTGAILLKQKSARPHPFAVGAKAVVLATGGAGEIFATNVFPKGMTGDGYRLAYEIGAKLVNIGEDEARLFRKLSQSYSQVRQ